ncbi:GNAT family N-acetyltransferase [Streptomyces meridianus]|uniref:GNAT family N-acetyltransferase n=1 Tax=Streptomyces meridianus TaxID=2938945 RepID=A0ABT0X5Q9_9ACTN|nr:GNAT family N-acetyltransferase [Streptomyces meridianus]MCM2577114.1 GNAT family N-acetyltransferase [Streptomyces meridianus]
MTTTLRPTGPERSGPGGQRSRDFRVCVNSRPVGSVHIGTDRRWGPSVGRIHDLRVDEGDRRRGRGAVAVLTAEEVLRSWGCHRIEATLPADATAALRLAGSLGYAERSRNMTKRLGGPGPELPDGTASRPMEEAEYRVWEEKARQEYARSWLDRGLPADEARAKAEADHARLLPDGLRTPGAVLRVLLHRGVAVGALWLAVGRELPDGAGTYTFGVDVAPEHRGRGHGRSLMLVGERESTEAGAQRTGLHVFADNAPALGLYRSLGYETSRINIVKTLV